MAEWICKEMQMTRRDGTAVGVCLARAKELVRCKDCKHRPKEPNLETYENGFDIEFPEDSKCPCQCSSDRYYSWYPEDNWFCAEGERRDG